MKNLLRDTIRELISEQEKKRKIISTFTVTYILVFDNSYLLNNVLTKIRVMEGVSTVYQRDTIKRSGNRSRVTIELSYLPTEGTGGSQAFLERLTSSIRHIDGVVRLDRVRKTV